MSTALDQRRVADLTSQELHDAWEWRLVQEGLDDVAAGRVHQATPEFFEEIKDFARGLAKNAA